MFFFMKICERIQHFIFSNHCLCKNGYNLFSVYFTMFGMPCYKVKLILIFMAHQINQIWDRDPKCLFILCVFPASHSLSLMICVPYFGKMKVLFSERAPPPKKRKERQEYEIVDVCMDCRGDFGTFLKAFTQSVHLLNPHTSKVSCFGQQHLYRLFIFKTTLL